MTGNSLDGDEDGDGLRMERRLNYTLINLLLTIYGNYGDDKGGD